VGIAQPTVDNLSTLTGLHRSNRMTKVLSLGFRGSSQRRKTDSYSNNPVHPR
jgi:hypothetical protein